MEEDREREEMEKAQREREPQDKERFETSGTPTADSQAEEPRSESSDPEERPIRPKLNKITMGERVTRAADGTIIERQIGNEKVGWHVLPARKERSYLNDRPQKKPGDPEI